MTITPFELRALIGRNGYAFADAPTMRALLDVDALADWPAFVASWDRLGDDRYLAEKGRHRRRRHAVFSTDGNGAIVRQPNQPHYQSLAYNNLQGGIERWFEPIEPMIAAGASLTRILAFCREQFGALAPTTAHWRIEVHQFRIEARTAEAGEPTPEGVHRDGVDYVLVFMIDRTNIKRGVTTIHAPDGHELGHFTLAHPFEAELIDDHRVFHGVTPVLPKTAGEPAHRDVLVVTFKAD